jgi:ribosomal protein L37E
MRNSLWAKAAIGVLLLAVGLTLVSGQVSQTYAYSHHHSGYSSVYWYYPYYSYYYPYYYSGYNNYGYGYYNQPAQYQLTVNTNPSSVSSQATGGGSYNYGSSASFSAQSVIQVSKDTRYVFKGWSGDYSGASASASITMDSSKTVTAAYQMQYMLTVSAQPSNAPSPQGGGWYNAGDTAPLTAPSQTVGGSNGTRLVLNGWSVDGNNQASSTTNLQMNAPHTVTAMYKQQYYLTVMSDQGVPSGAGWYDAGTYAPISVSTPANPSYGVSLVFNGWQGNGVQSPSQSTQVMMDGAKTVTATWRTDATLLYATIAVVLIAILLVAGAGFYSMTQRKRGTNGTEFCSRCGRPFRPSNSYCVSCGTPRANASSNPETPQSTKDNQSQSHHSRNSTRHHTEGTSTSTE